jgi:predicted methyltransferase
MRTSAAIPLLCFLALSGPGEGAPAGASPSINGPFLDPDPEAFAEQWEKEGREVFDRREAIVEACGLREGMTVADIGAGTGLFARLFAKKVGPAGRVLAVDVSGPFVDHILRRAAEEGLSNVKGVRCLPDDAGLPEGEVDFVFVCDTYHHFESPAATLRSIFDGMKPGATMLVIDFRRVEGESSEWVLSHVRAGAEVVRAEIESAGFVFVEELPLLRENYALRFRRP